MMDSNVLDYEPHLALFVPDDDPLLFYRAIAEYAGKHLKPSGSLYFEINQAYPTEITSLLTQLRFSQVTVHPDMYEKPRFISALKE